MREKEIDLQRIYQQITAIDDGAISLEEKVALAHFVRTASAEKSRQLDRQLLDNHAQLTLAVHQTKAILDQQQAIIHKLTAPPLYPAVVCGIAFPTQGMQIMVQAGTARRVVTVAEELAAEELALGDEVLLASEMNIALARSPFHSLQGGETALFERYTEDDRLVLKAREDEIIVTASEALQKVSLQHGDLIRWERSSWLALERLEPPDGQHLFLEDTPSVTFAEIGGLDALIQDLQETIALHFFHPEIVAKYPQPRVGSVLLSGPPGVGKTMIAKALANWMAQLAPSGRSQFIALKGADLLSMWYGESEKNIRNIFRQAREASCTDPALPIVLFLDEVDSLAPTRGTSFMQVDDRVVNALAVELDGLQQRGNILVVAATNRRDALDPKINRPGRLGDFPLDVPRPTMKAARTIFAKHLPTTLPFAVNGCGHDQAATRQHLIEAAISQLYAPNGDNELATITFRDGKQRSVRASDLLSGASLANIAQASIRTASWRELKTGESGLKLSDLQAAIAKECASLSSVLTPMNCHHYLQNLPQDVGVVSVVPVERKAAPLHRFINTA